MTIESNISSAPSRRFANTGGIDSDKVACKTENSPSAFPFPLSFLVETAPFLALCLSFFTFSVFVRFDDGTSSPACLRFLVFRTGCDIMQDRLCALG